MPHVFAKRVCVIAPIVSMIDGELFDKLARIGGIIRKNKTEPFGGIQVMCLDVPGDLWG